jgi:arylsulfatase A-like enzyme
VGAFCQLLFASLLIALIAPLARAASPTTRPNIVFILADDLGWTDLHCYGSQYYETPNIDRLASQGMKFTDGYSAAPNCAPSRAALLSGQYEPRTGVYTVGNIDRFNWRSRPLRPVDNVTKLPLDKITFARALKDAGYATAMFGKWHLGPPDSPFAPEHRGFDQAIESAGKHFDFVTHPPVDHPKDQYLADFLTDHGVDFITQHKDQPFLLYLPLYVVHSPYDAKQDNIDKFKNKPGVDGQNDPTYAAMVTSVDQSVGRIMETLDKLHLADNTLLIFSSDNGGVGGYAAAGVDKAKSITDNAPLRGGKGMLYEGGVRVPYIFRWPGKIPAGSVSHQPIIGLDLYPTFMEITHTPVPKSEPLDGLSLLPVLTQNKPLDRDTLYWHFPGYLGAKGNSWRTTPGGAIRVGDYKLIQYFEDMHVELYNLKDDLGQHHDLAKEKPELAKKLLDKLVQWREQTHAKMPTPITEQDKASKPKKLGKKKNKNQSVEQN